MRERPSEWIESGRVIEGEGATPRGAIFGFFVVKIATGFSANTRRKKWGRLIARSSGPFNGWEHVAVTVDGRLPTWEEMARIKSAFWEDHEVAAQFFAEGSGRTGALHLWRKVESVDGSLLRRFARRLLRPFRKPVGEFELPPGGEV